MITPTPKLSSAATNWVTFLVNTRIYKAYVTVEDISSQVKETAGYRNGFKKGYSPVKVLGASNYNGQLMYLIQWENVDEADLVPSKEARVKCPQLVIDFLEENLSFHSDDEESFLSQFCR